MRVTFDSNAYRLVVDPTRFPKDPRQAALQSIHAALRDGRISGLLSETVATLEGVQNVQRGPYFSNLTPKISIIEEEQPDGSIKIGVGLKPNDGLHPGLHPMLSQWLAAAEGLGIKFMHAPRTGVPRPTELLREVYDKEPNEIHMARRQGRFFDLLREIEKRGVGIAIVKSLGNQMNVRLGVAEPWFASLDKPKDVHEENQIKRAVGEWADGDTVAAQYGYDNDFLCSEDQGNSAGTGSIFDAANRSWLQSTHDVEFLTIGELAQRL